MPEKKKKDRLDQIIELQKIFLDGSQHTPEELKRKLKCSRYTLYRHIDAAKEMGMPISYNRSEGAYEMESGSSVQMPYVWFNSSDVIAMLALLQAFREIPFGILEEGEKKDGLDRFRNKLKTFILREKVDSKDLLAKIKIIPHQFRKTPPKLLTLICSALTEKKRIKIKYTERQEGRESEREISPAQLVRYRDNWYIDAWCHNDGKLKIFSLDRIDEAEISNRTYMKVTAKQLSDFVGSSYGIFAGDPAETAVLWFNKDMAKWASSEEWHPRQEGKLEPDGSYTLKVPYSDARELMGDILRYGEGVKVIEPADLKNKIKKRLKKALEQY